MYLDLVKTPLVMRQPISRPVPQAAAQTPTPRTAPKREDLSAWASRALRANGFGDAV